MWSEYGVKKAKQPSHIVFKWLCCLASIFNGMVCGFKTLLKL